MIGFLMIVAALPMSRFYAPVFYPKRRVSLLGDSRKPAPIVAAFFLDSQLPYGAGFALLCANPVNTHRMSPVFLVCSSSHASGYRAVGHDSREARTARPRPSFMLCAGAVLSYGAGAWLLGLAAANTLRTLGLAGFFLWLLRRVPRLFAVPVSSTPIVASAFYCFSLGISPAVDFCTD